MTAVNITSGPNPRKKIFDIVVVPGAPKDVSPGGTHFNILAQAPGAAATYTIEYALTPDLGDWRPLKNDSAVDNTALPSGGTVAARTSTVAAPGVQLLRLTAITNSVRFVAYGL